MSDVSKEHDFSVPLEDPLLEASAQILAVWVKKHGAAGEARFNEIFEGDDMEKAEALIREATIEFWKDRINATT